MRHLKPLTILISAVLCLAVFSACANKDTEWNGSGADPDTDTSESIGDTSPEGNTSQENETTPVDGDGSETAVPEQNNLIDADEIPETVEFLREKVRETLDSAPDNIVDCIIISPDPSDTTRNIATTYINVTRGDTRYVYGESYYQMANSSQIKFFEEDLFITFFADDTGMYIHNFADGTKLFTDSETYDDVVTDYNVATLLNYFPSFSALLVYIETYLNRSSSIALTDDCFYLATLSEVVDVGLMLEDGSITNGELTIDTFTWSFRTNIEELELPIDKTEYSAFVNEE
ncbi:MAG: hypothetical protein LBN25_00400 [Christensenellaceae bacterium]|jgi:hypothetical protein|nr:hypothetical protein [Christensenellaceae bacterium]